MKNKRFHLSFLILSILILFTACTGDKSGRYLEQCQTVFTQLHDSSSTHYSSHTTYQNKQTITESYAEVWSAGSDFLSHAYDNDNEAWMLYKDADMYYKTGTDDSWLCHENVSTVALPPWKTNDWNTMGLQIMDVSKTGIDLLVTCSNNGEPSSSTVTFRFVGDTFHSLIFTEELTDSEDVVWLMTLTYTFHSMNDADIREKIDTAYTNIH